MEFYGRQDILSILDKRANGLNKGYRQNIAIIGAECIGKTYLTKYWLSRYCDRHTVCVYIEVNPQAPQGGQAAGIFLRKFIGTLLYAFLENSALTLKDDDIDFLIKKSERYAPQTCALARELIFERKRISAHDAFIGSLELTEVLHRETGKYCIVIFDEFHLLEALRIKDFYLSWRKQIMLNKHTMYILLSSRKQLANKIFASDLALLFGSFEKIELEAFDNKTAQSLVKDRLKSLPAPAHILNFIINFSSAHPFYLTVLCDAFRDYHVREPLLPVGLDSLISSLENIFIDSWGILNRRFSWIVSEIEKQFKEPSLSVKILLGLARGLTRTQTISGFAGKTKKEVSAVLNQFCACDVVSKNAESYYLNDRFFGFWLESVYALRLSSFTVDSESTKQLFRKWLSELYADFCSAQSREPAERILELFSQFNNESVELQKKRIRLDHFKEVKLLRLSGKQIKDGILARTPNCLWIAGFKEERVNEDDILEFVNLCKRFKYTKAQKRIFIAFDDIDPNARLIAKEAKINTWDMSLINSLLDIYDKPRIVK
ncbi:MAG: hypothetical protein A3J51_05650 [Omnitrophica WOR_2 bacterium RIFCSPHIGHO2_02_FULL_45_21]|nr:MAG: hypothetical protein A3J51_05650 [Omnitrophica WOR_2 bacterium RIFCSPHIGHO2_02_FULL_45_21]